MIIAAIFLPVTWYHIAGVRDAAANTLAIYVNGILDSQILATDGMPNMQNINLYFGNTPGVGNEYLKGRLDEVRIWGFALDEAKLNAQMKANLSGSEEGLVGLWKLNEGKGQIVFDETANVNHGHLGDINGLDNADPNWIPRDAISTENVPTHRTQIIF
ncbi:MAG: LamG domain-containing protein [bacterium]